MAAHVLVVDDISCNAKVLGAKLRAKYFEVVTSPNALSALSRADDSESAFVLLDVVMPGMDGFEVCRHIKSNPKTAYMPLVLATALDRRSDRVAGRKAGAQLLSCNPEPSHLGYGFEMPTPFVRARGSVVRGSVALSCDVARPPF